MIYMKPIISKNLGRSLFAPSLFTAVLFVSAVLAGLATSAAAAAATAPDLTATPKAPPASATGAASLSVPDGRYGLDKTHGYITFSYSHLGFSNPEVGFKVFDVELNLNAADPAASTFEARIDAASIDSRVDEFNKHLVGADYFDVENYPEITFVSGSIRMTSDTTADITGTLTIKDQSHPLTLAAVLNKAGMHPLARVPALGVSARATLSRSQWGLKKYVPMVSDEVELRIEIELPQAQATAAP